MRRELGLMLVVLTCPAGSMAQETRFELGQRLRLFERALERHDGAKARKRALGSLEKATPTFFSGQLGAAAGLLDRARLALLSDTEPGDEVVWAESLVVRPRGRLLDRTTKELTITVESFYRVSPGKPDKVQLRLTLLGSGARRLARATLDVPRLPLSGKLALEDVPEGDHRLQSEILVNGSVRASGEQTISFVAKPIDRLAKLKKGLEALSAKDPTTEKATLTRLLALLEPLAAGRTLETNLPGARLLSESEAVLEATQRGKRYYDGSRAGQFWLGLVNGTSSEAVRVQVPAEASKGKPLPLVVAMHGAGGSENMFFDGYGDGMVAKYCAKRGWLLVTTRASLFAFGGGPDVPRLVDALARIYPVDVERVVVVGHSMGAAHAVASAGRAPGRFRAVAALGGGGRFRESAEIKSLRFFIGAGDRDIGLSPATLLHRSLQKAGVKKVVFKRYDDVEHLTVVQLALPEVFAFFDEALAR